MTARWRIPPENWCGYCRARPAGRRCRPRAGARPRATARSRAGQRAVATCPSTICRPTGSTGLSVVVGSWKTKPTSSAAQRRSVSAIGAIDFRAAETDRARDLRRCPAAGRQPASAVTLLPEPDSPTMPSTSPGYTSNSMPRTAGDRPAPAGERRRSGHGPTGRVRPCQGTVRGADLRHYLNPIVRGISMLSMSSVKPRRSWRQRSAGIVGVGRDARMPSRPAPC